MADTSHANPSPEHQPFTVVHVSILVASVIGLGITCDMMWNEAVQSVELLWDWLLKVGLFLLLGYISAGLLATFGGYVVRQIQRERERRLRTSSLIQFITQVALDGAGTSLDDTPLHRAVRGAIGRVVPGFGKNPSPKRASRLIHTHRHRIRRDRAMVELYQCSRDAYLDESIAKLTQNVEQALERRQINPWFVACLILTLPLRAIRLRWDFQRHRDVFEEDELLANLPTWYRVVELNLLSNLTVMNEVARRSPVLRAAPQASPLPQAPSIKEEGNHQYEVALATLEQARQEVQTCGPQWDEPASLLRRVKRLAKEHQAYVSKEAGQLLQDASNWERRLASFPHETFDALVNQSIDASRWPQWFADGLEASIALHGVSASTSLHRRSCIRTFVLGDYEPAGIEPAPVDEEAAPVESEVDDQVELRVVPTNPVEELF